MPVKFFLSIGLTLLVSASGAMADEPIYVEPEPASEMQPCDAYGPGWYYLPGTTTCVKVSGDVRMQYGATRPQGGKRSN